LAGHPALEAWATGPLPRFAAPPAAQAHTYALWQAEAEGPHGTTPARLLALADLADAIGARTRPVDPVASLPWFRDASGYAAFALMAAAPGAGAESPDIARALARHNHAVEKLLRAAGTGPDPVNPAWREQLAAAGVVIAATTPPRATIPYHELWIASDFRVKNLEPVGESGLGVPLITLSRFPDRSAVPDRFLPQRLRLPATAVLHPDGPLQGGAWRRHPAVLELHDPVDEPGAVLGTGPGTQRWPLAADLTTPMAHQFLRSPLTQLAWGGLLRPEAYTRELGMFMDGPYQPGKIPVLFIHGLWSSPDAWLVMANRLQADPLLRAHYQFWFAYYPTGAPLLISAGRLRRSLQDLRAAVDPGHADRALDRMVVVGHSLGGVVSKQLLQSSGRRIEQALLTVPIDTVAMQPETRRLLSSYLYFTPEPSFARAVFIAAPHRGSNVASRSIGRLGSLLVRRPGDIAAVHAEVIALNGPAVLQPAYRERPPSSIDNLEWDSPILKGLSELPINPEVPYHTIVANLFPGAPSERWTDGVVAYPSTHLDGAASEVMIRHHHFVNETIEAAAEVRRILALHLESGLGNASGVCPTSKHRVE
jgi:hypothetical protein